MFHHGRTEEDQSRPVRLLSTHGQMIAAIHRHPHATLRELAAAIDVTIQTACTVIDDLVREQVISRTRVGRRSHRSFLGDTSLQIPGGAIAVRRVLELIGSGAPGSPTTESSAPLSTPGVVDRVVENPSLAEVLESLLEPAHRTALVWLLDQSKSSQSNRFLVTAVGGGAELSWPSSGSIVVDHSVVARLLGTGLIRGNPAVMMARFVLTSDGVDVARVALQRASGSTTD